MSETVEKPSSGHLEAVPEPEDWVPERESEKKLLRKLDRTILPWIMLTYFVSYMDRSNLGNARSIGLEKDLYLTSKQFETAASTFYVGTVIFSTVGGIMMRVVSPSAWLALCMVGWGAISTLQAAATNAAGLAVLRLFLGIFEASFAPGCALYLTFWYLKSELSLRIAAYAGMSAFSGIFGGLIAYGLGNTSGLLLKGWQILFVVEGLPTFIFGVVTYWYLPDRPELGRHRWFTEEEHRIILHDGSYAVYSPERQWHRVVGNYRLYLFTLIYAGLSLSLAVISVFLPSIIKVLGYSGAKANLMTVPVYVTAYFCLIISAWISGYTQNRSLPIFAGGCIAGVGYLLLGLLHDHYARYASTFLIVVGTYMTFPIILAWIPSTFASDTKSGVGIEIVIAITHEVGIAGYYLYPSKDSPQFLMGSMVSCSLCFVACFGALLMACLLLRENRIRDLRHGRPEADSGAAAHSDADPNFRYTL